MGLACAEFVFALWNLASLLRSIHLTKKGVKYFIDQYY